MGGLHTAPLVKKKKKRAAARGVEGEKSVSALLYRKRVEAADTKRQVTHKSEEEKPWREKKKSTEID